MVECANLYGNDKDVLSEEGLCSKCKAILERMKKLNQEKKDGEKISDTSK